MPPCWSPANSPAKGSPHQQDEKHPPSGTVVEVHRTGIVTENLVSVHYMALYLDVDIMLNQPCISVIF